MGHFRDSLTSLVFAGDAGKAGEIVDERERGGGAAIFGTNHHGYSGEYSGGTAERMLEAYGAGRERSIDLVADCLEVIGQTVASADWYLENPTAQTREAARIPKYRYEAGDHERIAPSELVDLFTMANPWMEWGELIELTWIDWLLTGDMFILKANPNFLGQPDSLYRMSPALVEVVPGERGTLIGAYKYHTPGGTPIEFAPQDVIHLRRPNPHNPYRGAGVIACGPRIFDLEVALQETKASYFEKGARLGGVLESDNSISPGLIENVRREFAGLFAGAANSYQIPVLSRGLHFKPMQGNAAEAEFVKMTEKSQERVLAKFRVPRRKLGLPIETSATTAPQAEDRTFAQDVMRPAMNRFQNAITQQLTLPGWGLRYRIDYDYQMPIEDRVKLATEFATLPGVTVKEVRDFAGLQPLEGDSKDINEMVLNLPGDNEDESEIKDRPLGSEPGRPPKGENTASFDRANAADARVR